jgi:DNA-directed RNA polymerase subunit RPC12/RpoP
MLLCMYTACLFPVLFLFKNSERQKSAPRPPTARMCEHYWHVYVLAKAYFVWPWGPYRTLRDVTPGLLSATDTYIVYHVKHFEASRNVILHKRYISTYVGEGCGRGRETKKTKAIRCGACSYSIVLNAHRVTSMADTDIDAVRKQKKAEYDKQYRLKR